MNSCFRHIFAASVLTTSLYGCAPTVKLPTGSSWHQKCGWKAEQYFDDASVVKLCHALESNDLEQIDQLVAAGTDVNAQGKGSMTPLLWAFPDNKLPRFRRLLELGADPNIIITSSFNSHGAMSAGDSVTHMACETAFPGYFDAVFAGLGDPNLVSRSNLHQGDTPLFAVIRSGGVNKMQKIQTLLDRGADINYVNASGATPVVQAVSWGGQYDLALMLLNAGAEHKVYQLGSNARLIHQVLAEERRSGTWTSQQKQDYQQLINELVKRGESLDTARADRARWKSWSQSNGEYRRRMEAEVAERLAREQAMAKPKKK